MGQIIPVANVPEDIESYQCAENEVNIIIPLYDITTKEFKVLKKTLGLISVRADEKEVFLNYGYDKEKSKILYAA